MWNTAQASDDLRAMERVVRQVLPLAGRWKRIDIGLQAVTCADAFVCALGFEALRRALTEWNRGYPDRTKYPGLLRQRLEDARPALSDIRYRRAHPMLLESLETLLR